MGIRKFEFVAKPQFVLWFISSWIQTFKSKIIFLFNFFFCLPISWNQDICLYQGILDKKVYQNICLHQSILDKNLYQNIYLYQGILDKNVYQNGDTVKVDITIELHPARKVRKELSKIAANSNFIRFEVT